MMKNNDNLELFKKAVEEGLLNKIDSIANGCNEEVVCSEKHRLAIRTIMYGKIEKHKKLSPKTRRIIAILVAAALILTSCGIIFRDEMRMIFKEFYVSVVSSENDVKGQLIEEIYEPSYIPEGYILEEEAVSMSEVYYAYYNSEGEMLTFSQSPLNGTIYNYDTENSTTTPIVIDGITFYHTIATIREYYLWNDGKYVFEISSSAGLSTDELKLMINGLKIK